MRHFNRESFFCVVLRQQTHPQCGLRLLHEDDGCADGHGHLCCEGRGGAEVWRVPPAGEKSSIFSLNWRPFTGPGSPASFLADAAYLCVQVLLLGRELSAVWGSVRWPHSVGLAEQHCDHQDPRTLRWISSILIQKSLQFKYNSCCSFFLISLLGIFCDC